jgi:two-component system chemotaxis sensor kinase CheA
VESIRSRWCETEATQGIVVILQSAGRRYALLVDQLIGQHQVVVKTSKATTAKCLVSPPIR